MARLVRTVLSDDLLRPQYRHLPNRRPMTGHCYVASEALFHLCGGKPAGLKPMRVRHEGGTHWYLSTPAGVVDATADQFETPVPYEHAVGNGFLTRQPSKRAAQVISRVGDVLLAAATSPSAANDN